MARHLGWRVILRIEDIDRSRCSREHEDSIRSALLWLGIDWDGEVSRQSLRRDHAIEVLTQLAERGDIFLAQHSRRELRESNAASAPHGSGDVLRFPAALRPPLERRVGARFDPSLGPWRWCNDLPPTTIRDGFLGEHDIDSQSVWGEPIVWSRDGVPSYQFAVSLDDGVDGVTDVIRGADLLESSALQSGLHRALSRSAPHWWHVPLAMDDAGQRLAKRTGAAALDHTHDRADELRGRVALLYGLADTDRPLARERFVELCEPSALAQALFSRRAGVRFAHRLGA